MNIIERWILARMLKRDVRQGFDHANNIKGIFGMVRDACENEFTEDNQATLDANLRYWFEECLKEYPHQKATARAQQEITERLGLEALKFYLVRHF